MNQEHEQPSTAAPEAPVTTPEPVAHDEDDAAFGAGFNEARGVDTAPAEKPEAKPAPETKEAAPQGTATEPPKAPEPVVDEWAGVNPKVRKEIEAIGTRLTSVDKLGEQLRNLHGSIGGLTQQQKALKDALAQATTSTKTHGADAPSTQQVQDATKSADLWKALKADYPDWAEAVDLRLAEIAAKSTPAAPTVDAEKLKTEVLADIDARISTASESSTSKGRILGYLDAKHGPDWETEIKSPEFDAWIQTQAKDVKDLCSSPRVTDASKLIDKFRDAKKKRAERDENTARLKRAAQPSGTAVTTVTEDEEQAFSRGFEEARGT